MISKILSSDKKLLSNLTAILRKHHCSLLLSTMDSGRTYVLFPQDGETLGVESRSFPNCVGVAIEEEKMAIATGGEVIVFKRFQPDTNSPKYLRVYDSHWLPRLTFHTGNLQMHDLHFGKEYLWGINTAYSCLCTFDADYSFTPRWQPNFVPTMAPDDYCHLNGLAMEDGRPRYATAFSGKGHWRENKYNGVVIDLANNEVLTDGLKHPHTPRIYEDELYVLVSGTGELVKVDRENGTKEVLLTLPGFPRGMVQVGEYLLIGISKLRASNPLAGRSINAAGIALVHLPTRELVTTTFLEEWPEAQLYGIEEIYDLQVIPNSIRPFISSPSKYAKTPTSQQGLFLPDGNRWNK